MESLALVAILVVIIGLAILLELAFESRRRRGDEVRRLAGGNAESSQRGGASMPDWLFNMVAIMVGLVILGGYWYLNVYDTAQGKCQRGDLGACLVWQAQHPTPAPPAPTERAAVGAPSNYSCYASVIDHNAVVGIYGDASCSQVQGRLFYVGFVAGTTIVPYGDSLVCSVSGSGWAADVWDSGGADYGSQACSALHEMAAVPSQPQQS